MGTAADKPKNIWRLVAVGYLVVLVILIVISQFLSGDAAVAIVSIPVTLAVVAGIVALAFKFSARPLRQMPQLMADLRRQYPIAYAIHFEIGGRGAIAIDNGELIVLALNRRGTALTAYGILNKGEYTIAAGRAQFARARKADGIVVTETDGGNNNKFALVLSHDNMKLQGNLLKGQDLAEAIKRLQRASKVKPAR